MRQWLLALTLLAALPAWAADRLHLYNWSDYMAPEAITAFEAQCRCQVVQSYYADNEELLAKLAAGAKGYDLMVPSTEILGGLIKQNLLLPLDKAQLPNLKNIGAGFLNNPADPEGRYSVPYAYTVTLIGYNEQKLAELGVDPNSWAVLFDPQVLQKIKGRVTALDSARELLGAALMYLGHPANSLDPAHWQEAAALIRQAKPYWAAFNASNYMQQLAAGHLWVVHGYSSDIFQAREDVRQAGRGFSIGFALPREGALVGMDHLVIHRNAPRPDLAHQFIDFILGGRLSAQLTNLIGSGNPNLAAREHIRPDILALTAIFPDEQTLARLQVPEELPSARERRALSRWWTEVKAR